MSGDPIVAEVRAIRDKFAAECGYDVKEIFRRIRRWQGESGLEYVSYPPRRVPAGEGGTGRPADRNGLRDDHGA